MDGFVTATQTAAPGGDKTAAMGYWTEQDLPFYHGLARTFPLADHWFSSCLGPTFPNRRFLLAGTAHGLIDDLPANIFDRPPAGTILDMLTTHRISWANYRPSAQDRSHFRRYLQYRRRRDPAIRLAPLGQPAAVAPPKASREICSSRPGLYPLGMARYMLHVRGIEQFFADADRGHAAGASASSTRSFD